MYKVLIVDDEPLILEGLKHIIPWDEHGLEIVGEAACGEDALDFLRRNKVHILITDIRMSGMSGLELLHRIKEQGWDIKCIILSGYDDFEYVKEAARLGIENYLLKPVSRQELSMTLLNTIKKIESSLYNKITERESKDILRNNILYRWVTNNISDSELTDRAPILSIDLGYSHYRAAIVKLQHTENISPKIQDRSLLSFSINNICSEIVQENGLGLSFCDLNGDIVILFHRLGSKLDVTQVLSILEKCVTNLRKYLGSDVFISVGCPVEHYSNICKSYTTANDLQEYFLIFPSKNIALFEDVHKAILPEHSRLAIDIGKFEDMVFNKDKAALKLFIIQAYDQLKQQESLTPQLLQNFTIELMLTLLNAVKNQKGSKAPLFFDMKSSLAEVIRQKSIEGLVESLASVVDITVDRLMEEDEKSNPIIKSILRYVHENYAGNISLKLLSDTFNINAAYLGQLFKNETGEMFTNYLNTVRVEKAKEFLLNTHLKVNEIAEKTGYVNQIYFIRIFRKVTGKTPLEFRGHS
jgi:two-component system, response regulator YesN